MQGNASATKTCIAVSVLLVRCRCLFFIGMEGNFDDSRIARDRYGRPLKDRYGRPIYRRVDEASPKHARPREADSRGASRRPIPPRSDRPSRAGAARPAPMPPRRSRPQPERRQAPLNETRIESRPPVNRAGSGRAGSDPRFPPPGYNPDADFQSSSHGSSQDYYSAPQAASSGRGGRRGSRGGAGVRSGFRMPRLRLPRLRFKSIILLLVIFLVVTMALVDIRLTRVDAFSGLADRPANTMSSNWLLVGSDSRTGLSEEDAAKLSTGSGDFGQRTDTIMIAHIPVLGKPKLVSIPRDSFVDIPGNDKNKINAAFAFGGPQLLIDTVEKNTGIHIDHYAEIGFGGFAGVVDAVGGIEMCPEEAIDDPLAGLNIQAGCQKFDGAGALGYVRTRATAQGDLDRVERQREFMSALMGRLKSPAVWLNPYRWIRLANAGTKAVFVGDGDHVWHLTWLMLRMLFGSDSLTVPTSGAMDTGYAGNVLLWDEIEAPALFAELR
ncbi:LCP family protein [Corynebacterium sp. MSK032]|nr:MULTISPECIES: LCP family protein [unclassified Corynebacterium]MDK8793044.1 LCP family protein [Corynebacterium sp. MSK032]OFL70908.1 transcriptional regulator [Corynebacterium sp. HMSC063G05]